MGSGETDTTRPCRGSCWPAPSARMWTLTRSPAEETLGNPEKARVWMLPPNRSLGGKTPLELVRRSSGSLLVERALGRLAHGVYS